MLCEKSHLVVEAKVCDLTEDLLWSVCGLFVGIFMSSLNHVAIPTGIKEKSVNI